MSELSDKARIVLGSVFGWGAVFTYHMVESIPSPEMDAALEELVQAGKVTREIGLPDMTRDAVRYRVADGVDLSPFRKEAFDRLAIGEEPRIRVFIKKGERP